MARRILAAISLFGASATALTQASGQAIVVNNCGYDVDLDNVPAANQGGTAVSETLSPGDTYSQYYTGLEAPHDGWSIKLSPSGDTSGQIIQFEYTYLPTSSVWSTIIWFDMSFVNGDPFKDDWQFTSNAPDCQSSLRHAAYMYSTDNFFGMQKPCSSSDNVILTICPNGGGSSTPSTSSGGGVLGGIVSAAGSMVSGLLNLDGSTPTPSSQAPASSAVVAPTSAAVTSAAPVVAASPATTPAATLDAIQMNAAPANVGSATDASSPSPSPSSSPSLPSSPSASAASPDSGVALQFAAGPGGFSGTGAVEDDKMANVNVDSAANAANAANQANEVSYVTNGNTVYAIQFATVNVYQTVDSPAPTAAAAAHKRHLHRHQQARHHHA